MATSDGGGAASDASSLTDGAAPDAAGLEGGALQSSGFNKDADGWTIVGDAQAQTAEPNYDGTLGLISAQDDVTGGTWYFQAPSKYLGDQSAAYGDYLEFDLQTTSVANPFDNYDVVLSGGGKVLAFVTDSDPSTTGWTSYRISLTETSGWKELTSEDEPYPSDFSTLPAPSRADFQAALADVTRLRIRGEFNTGADTGYLDNVKFGAIH
jgi:hypothetical protein